MKLESVGGREDDKGMDQKEKRKGDVEIGGRIASGGHCHLLYKEMLHMNCQTFEEIKTTIRPVITKTADRNTCGKTRKTIIDYHEEIEQA